MTKSLVPKDLKERDVFKTLQAYYEEGLTADGKPLIALSEFENNIRLRWESAFTLLCNFHSPKQAATQLQILYGISLDTALRDVRNATKLFGDVNKSSREGKKYLLYEYAMRILMKAMDSGDVKGMNGALHNMIRITGVDKEDLQMPEYDKEEIKQIIIQVNPAIVEQKNSKLMEAEIKRLLANKKNKTFNIDEAKIVEDGSQQ